jgi:NAD+ kinase
MEAGPTHDKDPILDQSPKPLRERANVYICKRPWETEEIRHAYCWIVKFLIEHTDVEYHLYLETTLREHEGSIQYATSPRCHYFEKISEVTEQIGYAITIGGDGTVLWAHKVFGETQQPVYLCFNGGTLCFLSIFPIVEVQDVMKTFHTKIASRTPFRTKVYPRLISQLCDSESCDLTKKYALNDISIERSTPSMVLLDLYLNDCFAVQIRADGVLISSSTGSTAYNLSLANGIIMHSDLECIIINPMASMSLSSRPIVVPSTCKVKIVCSQESRADGRLVYDGMDALVFSKGYSLNIECAPSRSQIIVPDDHHEYHDWIHKLRDLRGWK